jgi:hypothetical protein
MVVQFSPYPGTSGSISVVYWDEAIKGIQKKRNSDEEMRIDFFIVFFLGSLLTTCKINFL